MTQVKFALPKGHLGDQTMKVLERAGCRISGQNRTYRPSINDPGIELKVLGRENCLRVTVAPRPMMDRFIEALKEATQ